MSQQKSSPFTTQRPHLPVEGARADASFAGGTLTTSKRAGSGVVSELPDGKITLVDSDRPMSCPPLTHREILMRATVSDVGVITAKCECQTCFAEWTERRWRQ